MKRAASTLKYVATLGLLMLFLSGCAWNKKTGLSFNVQQRIVMEPSVLAAGVIVEKPVIKVGNVTATATINMSNIEKKPVTVMYRIFWYDEQGLRVDSTKSQPQVIPANSSVMLKEVTTSPLARNARIYVFLPSTAGESQ
ncbi:YcfL family protein [Providencia sp. JGM181]|uniref:YcfL family protein n=1 Tax=unclassified Providencia TaxID=2633465 RepID=UPI001BA7E3C8|nr:YcfL family protein [Providencia sp. JGM181]MBS0932901.1 YcfL family protein [Providencia sp. JGM172]MBS0997094.1 YcfL family protein [Providencia sp. JGM178]